MYMCKIAMLVKQICQNFLVTIRAVYMYNIHLYCSYLSYMSRCQALHFSVIAKVYFPALDIQMADNSLII